MQLLLWLEERIEANDLDPESGVQSGWQRQGGPEWFEVLPVGGREYLQAQQMQATVSHKLRSVFIPGVTPRMRLTQGNDRNNPERIFNIVSAINEGENNLHLIVMADEVV